ncbi:MAG: radical SAM protein [bacterium]|nr:radical SAM protein [bacterium]
MSSFTIRASSEDGAAIFKNTKTGAVVKLLATQKESLERWLCHQDGMPPDFIGSLVGTNGILVLQAVDEFHSYKEELLKTRNNRARIFSLHVEPTLQCQLECGYCFENGIDRGRGMSDEVFQKSVSWLNRYFMDHPEVEVLRVIFFGGEPLLQKDIVKKAITAYSQLARSQNLEYMTEIITNGELLTEDMAVFLSKYNWKRVQITLDGPREIHDVRRHGKNGRPTFDRIWANVLMLAQSGHVPMVDIRLSLDYSNVQHLSRLLEFMAQAGVQDKIRLSIGFIESSFFVQIQDVGETWQAKQVFKVWKNARDLGFKIPDEYASGPLCVAQAKHSAVLQPDGNLQKCFCTSGQNQHAFGNIFVNSSGYTRDLRYENFKRLDDCIKEKCPYIPICAGGCTYHAAVENGGTTESFSTRHCKKDLLHDLNEGLLKLSY